MQTTNITAATLVCMLSLGTTHAATINPFTGGDVGEGLDLAGTFIYAVNFGQGGQGGTGPNITVGDATFRDGFNGNANPQNLIPGTVPFYASQGPWGTAPTYGTTTNDTNLSTVMNSIVLPNSGRLSYGLTVVGGQQYKLQAIMNENHFGAGPGGNGSRSQNFLLYEGDYSDSVGTGRTAYDSASNVNLVNLVGAANTLTTGIVVTMNFTALNNGFVTLITTPGTGGTDTTPIINGLTLEAVPEPSSVALLGIFGGLALLRRRR